MPQGSDTVSGSGGAGSVRVGWSVTGTIVFLGSIGPDLTLLLFFDAMLGGRRCAVVWELFRLRLVPSVVIFCKLATLPDPKMMRCQQCGSLES